MAGEEDIAVKVKEARESPKKRKFNQTWDLIISLKGIDLKKPENRLNLEHQLPEGRGKQVKVGVIADSLATKAREEADLVVVKEEIDALSKDVKRVKAMIDEHDWFFGEMSLMPLIGKTLGQLMGPKGKMPKPLPPNANIKTFIENAKKTIRIRLTTTPVIQVPVGSEDMDDEKIANNANSVINFVKEKLPKGKNNIRAVYIKLTMGKAVKLPLRF